MFYNTNINYNATYEVESIDENTIRLIATSNDGNNIIKEITSKIQRLADIQNIKASLVAQKASFDAQITFLDNLTTLIEG